MGRIAFPHQLTFGEIVGIFGIDKENTALFDRINYRTIELLRQGRATEAPTQSLTPTTDRGIGILGTVNHDGSSSGIVIKALLQPIKPK